MKLNNRKDLQTLRETINSQLKQIDPNLKFDIGSISYQNDGSFATMKLKVLAVQENGVIVTPERKSLDQMVSYGLTPFNKENVDKPFNVGGRTFTVVGYKTKARKNPYIVEEVSTGKRFVMPESTVKFAVQ